MLLVHSAGFWEIGHDVRIVIKHPFVPVLVIDVVGLLIVRPKRTIGFYIGFTDNALHGHLQSGCLLAIGIIIIGPKVNRLTDRCENEGKCGKSHEKYSSLHVIHSFICDKGKAKRLNSQRFWLKILSCVDLGYKSGIQDTA